MRKKTHCGAHHGSLSAPGPSAVSGFRGLQRGLTGKRALIGAAYMDDPAMLRAYLDYYWPVSFEQTRHALAVSAFLASRLDSAVAPRFPFRRIIDVGSGPGPVAAALVKAGADEAVLIDQSARALDLAREVVPALHLTVVVADISRPEPSSIPLWGKADCVSFGHSLNEIASGSEERIERRVALLARYAEALAPGGCILIIEPAILSASRDLLEVRNRLVEKSWRVIAPCPGRSSLSCPALAAGQAHTCHDEIFWTMPPAASELARSMGLDKETLKMTWFLLKPPEKTGESPLSLNSTLTGEPDSCLYRVVSDPMLNKGGRIRRLVCGSGGRFPLSAPDGSQDAARSGFDSLSRGDYLAVKDPEPRENGWGVAEGTEITIARRNGSAGSKK